MQTNIQLLAGLGNPGPEYANTRHNAGVWFIEKLLEHTSIKLRAEKKFHGLSGKITFSNKEFHLLIPTSYMNCCGQALVAMAKFYKIPPQNILIAHDELAIPTGVARFKQGGGHAGHNGLRDIIRHLNNSDFMRLRIGIDHPGNRDQVSNYVLSPPSKTDKIKIDQAIEKAITILPDLLAGNLQQAMQELH